MMPSCRFARERLPSGRFTPPVAIFNERALAVYERFGPRRGAMYTHDIKGTDHPFLAVARKG
jgi:hypothetical protein